MHRGYIKLFRKIADWGWYRNSHMVHLFVHLLIRANHTDKEWQGITIKRGQCLTGRKKLSQETGISEQRIRTCLQKMVKNKDIVAKSTNKFTLITICNYDTYQAQISENNQQLTNNQPTTNQQLTTTNNDKEQLKKEYIYSDSDFNFENFIVEYNRSNPPTRIRQLDDRRKHNILSLINEHNFTKEDWRDVMYRFKTMDRETAYLHGGGGKGLKMDFDWLTIPDNFRKVLEGGFGGNDRQMAIEADRRRAEGRRKHEEQLQLRKEREQREQQEREQREQQELEAPRENHNDF